MKKMDHGSPDDLKRMYEALGTLQKEIYEKEDFEHRNEFREDYRDWKYAPECGCTRCSRMGEGVYEQI